jgi:hypothetical protein
VVSRDSGLRGGDRKLRRGQAAGQAGGELEHACGEVNSTIGRTALDEMDPHGRNPDAQAVRGYIHGRSGRTDEARRILGQLDSLGMDPGALAFQKAAVHLSLGERDQALDRLEESAERENWQIRLIGVEPTFDPLRADPRFHALLRKVNLDG